MALVRHLSFAALGMGLMAIPAHAASEPPFAQGFYVPADLAKSCKDRNFQTYDWVLRFGSSRDGRLTMGSSDGVCSLSSLKKLPSSRYRGQLECNSQGELSESQITFKIGAGKQITEIDGEPYVSCGSRK